MRAGQPVRISCQLVEAASGQHLWPDRFDSTLDDSFDLQDKITESVIASIARAARGRDRTRPAQARDGQDAYDLTLLAFPQTFIETPERNEEALRLGREAL